jgi:TetR/AcrR family transcriptional repressor of nem operon
VFAALGGEVARSSDPVRSTVTKGVRAQLGILERVAKGRSKAARRKQAITALSGMVGAMVVARLVNDSALSNELLTIAASAFGAHKHDNQKRTAV